MSMLQFSVDGTGTRLQRDQYHGDGYYTPGKNLGTKYIGGI